jgi:hypothetical protein
VPFDPVCGSGRRSIIDDMAKVRGDAEWQRRKPRLAGFLTQEEIQAAFDATDRPAQRLRHLSGVVLNGMQQVIWGRVFKTERDMSRDIPRPFPEVVRALLHAFPRSGYPILDLSDTERGARIVARRPWGLNIEGTIVFIVTPLAADPPATRLHGRTAVSGQFTDLGTGVSALRRVLFEVEKELRATPSRGVDE